MLCPGSAVHSLCEHGHCATLLFLCLRQTVGNNYDFPIEHIYETVPKHNPTQSISNTAIKVSQKL